MSPEAEKLMKSYIPMSEPSFLLLSTLVEELHGYGIMHKASEVTGGRVALGAGTVYTILYKMECDGLIRVVQEAGRRKIYRITPVGVEVLKAESNRIMELSRVAAHVLEQCNGILDGYT